MIEYGKKFLQVLTDLGNQITACVTARPVYTVVSAFVVGYVLGALVS